MRTIHLSVMILAALVVVLPRLDPACGQVPAAGSPSGSPGQPGPALGLATALEDTTGGQGAEAEGRP